MSKNVIVISSSPRKGGNSDLLCDAFMEGAREAGNVVEKLQLSEITLNYCDGCGACFSRKEPCPQKDEITMIEEKMVAADVVVLASPLYFYTMSGKMKTFIDRACAYYEKMQDTEFYYIVTCADESREAVDCVVEGFHGLVRCIDGAVEKGIIYGTGLLEQGEVRQRRLLHESYEMGRQV